jgi:hypothetical protein
VQGKLPDIPMKVRPESAKAVIFVAAAVVACGGGSLFPSNVPPEQTRSTERPPAVYLSPIPSVSPAQAPTTSFSIGDRAYPIPSNRSAIYPLIAVVPNTVGFFGHVEDCNQLRDQVLSAHDFTSLLPDENKRHFSFGQPGSVINVLACPIGTYYLLRASDPGDGVWTDWVTEDQISFDPPDPVGISFYLTTDDDPFRVQEDPQLSPSADTERIPSDLLTTVGQQVPTSIHGIPVQLTLVSVEATGDGRSFTTLFTIVNNGHEALTFSTADIMLGSNNGILKHFLSSVDQLVPAQVEAPPGTETAFHVAWTADYPGAIFITVNADPISDYRIVTVNDDSVFFEFMNPNPSEGE